MLQGTLSYNLETRRHILRGMWSYEASNNQPVPPPQRFELLRTLSPSEDIRVLPLDGEFHGSFSIVQLYTTSKGKTKERAQVISESGVKLSFDKVDDDDTVYNVKGKGTNNFGTFTLMGTATEEDIPDMDKTYKIEMRKSYVSSSPVPPIIKKKKNLKRKQPSGELPNVSESYPTGVLCLRGKLVREGVEDVSGTQVIHKITGNFP